MALNESVLEAVANGNFKTVAEAATIDHLGHSKRLNLIAESSLGQILNRMNSLDPAEAASVAKVNASDLGAKMTELAGAVANAQQLMKGAGSTPPVTITGAAPA